jgi:rod shape-determining protein MreC
MSQLFGILYKIRHFFIFLLLQGVCFFLISKNSVYWDVTAFNSTNAFVAKSMTINQNIHEFINLDKINDQLVLENKILRTQLTEKNEELALNNTGYKVDTVASKRYTFLVAKVIKSTQNLSDNYITIDKGTRDGLKPGMGVICPQGVVGQIMTCNENYSRISSILHSKFSISAEIINKSLKKENVRALGIGKWESGNPSVISLNTVDRFKSVFKGDTVVTSMQNSVFPPQIMIGRISKIQVNQTEAFFDINVRLSTDFSSLIYVYVVNNKLVEQENALEKTPEQ